MKKVIELNGISLLSTIVLYFFCASMELKDINGKIIENSLAEKLFIEIGGVKQGLFLRSENQENPVI